MAEATKLFVLFVAILICGQNKLCSAFDIDISPDRIRAVGDGPASISCTPSKSLDLEAKYVMTMTVVGLDGKPLALLARGSDAPHSTGNSSELQIEGHINDNIVSQSRLTVTLLNPTEEDAGAYRCVMYFLDNSYRLKEKTVEANLTSEKPDIKSVVEYCNEKMSELAVEFDTKLEERTKYFREMETYLTDRLSVLETKQANNHSNSDYISAFSAKYTVSGSEVAEQTIVFNKVIMKEGEGYDENTGLYTAPRSGIYGFHVVAIMSSKNTYIDLKLEVNDKVMAGLSAGSESKYYDQSSISVLFKLEAGDVVNVAVKSKSGTTAKLQASEFTLFTGYLLRETP